MPDLGQIGLDEGAIFESLRDPVWSQTVVKTRHNKAGLVTSVKTTTKQLTGSQAFALVLGPALLAMVVKGKDLLEDTTLPGILGDVIDPTGAFSSDPSEWQNFWKKLFRDIIFPW